VLSASSTRAISTTQKRQQKSFTTGVPSDSFEHDDEAAAHARQSIRPARVVVTQDFIPDPGIGIRSASRAEQIYSGFIRAMRGCESRGLFRRRRRRLG
jgi:hypothetical protein